MDIISGSFPGELYFFRGTDEGFATPQILQGANGLPINVGKSSTPFAFDWSGNGILDLLVGDIHGSVRIIPGEGRLKFGKPYKLQHNGEDIFVGRDSHPTMADWDGDGIPDLILGRGTGRVEWYRNTARQGPPKLVDPVTLVGDAKQDFVSPGIRSKVHVVDYTGDGRMDLLVGDHDERNVLPTGFTEDDIKERNELEARNREASRRSAVQSQSLRESVLKELGIESEAEMTPEQSVEFLVAFKKAMNADEEYQATLEEMREIGARMDRFRGTRERRGNVWLFKRGAKGER